MGKLKRSGAFLLPVAEVDEILAILKSARVPKDLSGTQRQQLGKAYATLARTKAKVMNGSVHVPVTTLREVLRCISMTQHWFEQMVAEH
jgi:hypothetical protein